MKKDASNGNKREQKAKVKEDDAVVKSEEKVAAATDGGDGERMNDEKLQMMAVRKSSRISKIIGESKVEKEGEQAAASQKPDAAA